MTDRTQDNAASFEALSALADGESTERDVARACQAWRDSDGARGRWHAYQLIGDAMRSDSLAATRSSDADFLSAVRDRLVQEPVVLAPAPKVAKSGASGTPGSELLPGSLDGQVARQRRWAGPVSVAAGFVLVLGAVLNVVNGVGQAPMPAGQGAVAALTQNNNSALGSDMTQASWPAPEMTPGVSSVLRSGLAAESSVGQRMVSSRPSFTQHARVDADGHSGYLVFVRDDQLDQLLAARREQVEARSLVSPASDLIRNASFDASQP